MLRVHLLSYKYTLIIGIILSIISLGFDIKVACGILFGILVSFIYRLVLTYVMSNIIKSQNSSKFYTMGLSLMISTIYIFAFGISFIFNNILNYMGVFIGLMLEKIVFIVMNIRG